MGHISKRMVRAVTTGETERVAKRHAEKKSKKVEGISDAAIRRLTLRSHSAMQLSGQVYDQIRKLVEPQISETLRSAILLAASDKRSTITTSDVELALRGQGRTVYGLKH